MSNQQDEFGSDIVKLLQNKELSLDELLNSDLSEKSSYMNDIHNIRLIITQILETLRDRDAADKIYMDNLPLWNEKEDIMSVLTKITGILAKILPMEQKIASEQAIDASDEDFLANEEALEAYVQHRINLYENNNILEV
jgi:hypothetical protein